ncbi:hypothetical protein RHOER0001_4878 [Rhodococcus erythropolis SK121]|nr:hypothetical protein RHOER0001_4878 [Rhodococcus erythropolis SK121]
MIPLVRLVLCLLVGCFVALTSTLVRRRSRPETADVAIGIIASLAVAAMLGVD